MSIYLVDYENVNLGGLNGVETLKEDDRVFIFYGQNPGYIPFEKHILICKAKASIEYLRVDRQAKNYLDFQLATYSGYLIAKYDDRDYVIVSKDTGFDSIVNFWNRDPEGLGVHFTRRESILVPPAPQTKKQNREKEPKPETTEQNGVARPSSSLFRRSAEAPVIKEPAIEEAPVLPTAEPEPALEEKTEAAEPETKSRSRRNRRRRGKKRDTPVESEGLLPEVTAEAEASEAEEIPAETVTEEEEEKFDPDSLSLGISPEDQLSDRTKRIVEADDMLEALRKEDEKDEEAKAEEPSPAEEEIPEEPKAEEKPAEEKKELRPETGVQTGPRKPRIRYGRGRKEKSAEEAAEAPAKEAPAAEEPAEAPAELAPAVEEPAPAIEEPAPVEEPAAEPAPAEEKPAEEPAAEAPAEEAAPEAEEIPVEAVPVPVEKSAEAKSEKAPAKPAKLPERIKSKIREAVKDEKLSSGAYTQLYNRILKSANGETLKAELVKSFSAEKGAKLYELILPAFTEYLTTKK